MTDSIGFISCVDIKNEREFLRLTSDIHDYGEAYLKNNIYPVAYTYALHARCSQRIDQSYLRYDTTVIDHLERVIKYYTNLKVHPGEIFPFKYPYNFPVFCRIAEADIPTWTNLWGDHYQMMSVLLIILHETFYKSIEELVGRCSAVLDTVSLTSEERVVLDKWLFQIVDEYAQFLSVTGWRIPEQRSLSFLTRGFIEEKTQENK